MPTTNTISQTINTATTSTTTSATTSPLAPVAIIDLILSDINALVPNFNSLVASYRLLVGAAEEIHRTPGICPDVFERAVRRFDNTGTLIDVLLELLCCKIVFSADLLKTTCGPVDLVRYLLTCLDGDDNPCRSAESVVGLAALKRLQDSFCKDHYCLPDRPVVCPIQPQAPIPPKTGSAIANSDIADVVESKILTNFSQSGQLTDDKDLETELENDLDTSVDDELDTETDLRFVSRLRLKHLLADETKRKNGLHQRRSPSSGHVPSSS